ncbi:MAG: hypothetical protein ABIP93_09785 [Gemmatimonadaceae bacterium]
MTDEQFQRVRNASGDAEDGRRRPAADGTGSAKESHTSRKASDLADPSSIRRWGGNEILFANGFLAVPRTFLLHASRMGITPSEVHFILVLLTFKWNDANPFPSYELLAAMLDTSAAQARKLARQLDEKGFLRRIPRFRQTGGKSTNEFDLGPLFGRLEQRALSDLMIDRKVTR